MIELTIRETADFLLNRDHFLILCHRNPDGDTLGSGYALQSALRALGKKADILCNDAPARKFTFLFSKQQPTENQYQTIVSVDVADQNLLGDALSSYRDRVDLAIDHHCSHRPFARFLLLDSKAAANCEIIYRLLLEMKVEITKEMADFLYAGIMTDTGCFCYRNVTPATHRIAADLIALNTDYGEINHRLFETVSQRELFLQEKVLKDLTYHCEGQVAVITVTLDMLTDANVTEGELDGITALPRKIEGVEIGIVIKQRGEKEYKVSMRSSGIIDVSKICARFNGGGHVGAAGCTLHGDLPSVKEQLLKAAKEALL